MNETHVSGLMEVFFFPFLLLHLIIMALSEAAEINDVSIKNKICSGKMSKQNIKRVPVHAHELLYIQCVRKPFGADMQAV